MNFAIREPTPTARGFGPFRAKHCVLARRTSPLDRQVEYLELLDDGGIDAFVGHADRVPPRFLSTSLLQDPLVLLARRGHPIFKTLIGMKDLVTWPQILVSPTGEARGAVDPILKQQGAA